jgi:hypothetical protein
VTVRRPSVTPLPRTTDLPHGTLVPHVTAVPERVDGWVGGRPIGSRDADSGSCS